MTATNRSRSKAREAAAAHVAAVWDEWVTGRPDTYDPQFWAKYAAHDEALADAYRALSRELDVSTHDRALAMALHDAEAHRRRQAKDERRYAAEANEAVSR